MKIDIDDLKDKVLIALAIFIVVAWFSVLAYSLVKFQNEQNELKKKAVKYDLMVNEVNKNE